MRIMKAARRGFVKSRLRVQLSAKQHTLYLDNDTGNSAGYATYHFFFVSNFKSKDPKKLR
jgi:hypothetical protein